MTPFDVIFTGFTLLIAFFFGCASDSFKMGVFIFILILSVAAFYRQGTYECYISSPECTKSVNMQTIEDEKAEDAHDEYCRGADIVSEQDGVKLYVTRCTNRPVYFSKSGTTTTHEEHHGKSSETVTDIVPNAQ